MRGAPLCSALSKSECCVARRIHELALASTQHEGPLRKLSGICVLLLTRSLCFTKKTAECAVEADLVWNLDLLLDGLPVIEMYDIVSGRVGFQKPNSPVRVFGFWFLYSGFCILKVRHGFLVYEKARGCPPPRPLPAVRVVAWDGWFAD